MYAQERQERIAGLVAGRGRVSVTEVASRYEVTTETVRRDLAVLERAGVVRRVHGGAVSATTVSLVELAVPERDTTMAAAGDRIAAAAIGLLPLEGHSILLDAATTTNRVARLLSAGHDLTVVTNSVPIAARVAGTRGLRLHLLGGQAGGRRRRPWARKRSGRSPTFGLMSPFSPPTPSPSSTASSLRTRMRLR